MYSSSNVSVYLNGNLLQSISSTETASLGTNVLYIGKHNNDAGTYGTTRLFKGEMDEVRIWHVARTQSEIQDNMYKSLAGNESNLAAYYKMSNGSGSTLNDDQSSSNYDVTISGASWVSSGAFSGSRNCLSFDGSNDQLTASVGYSAIGYGDFTIEGWICPSTLAGDHRMIVADNTLDNFQFNLNNGGTSAKMQFYTNTNTNVIESDALSWTLNQWYHVAVVRNSGVITFYRDGVACGSGTRNLSISGSSNIYVGRRPYGSAYHPFNGKIDEIRIWNNALSAEQLRENMNKSLSGTESGLLLYYRFDHGIAAGTNTGITTVYDLTSNSYDGTLTNFSLSGSSSNWISSSAFNTWVGSESTAWSTAGNWSSGSAPASADNIGVYDYTNGNDPIISSATTVNNLLVGSGANLSVGEGYSLTVSGNLHNNGTLSIESNGMGASATGSLITSGTNTYGASCTTRVERYIDGGTGGYYHFLSSPVLNATGSSLSSDYNMYDWDETNNEWDRIFSSSNLTSGKGYTAAFSSSKTLSFSGELNNGNINVSVTKGSGGYNLIGNPYPSRLNANAFVVDGDNSEISGTLYYWTDDHSTGSGYSTADYSSWNTAGSTGSGANSAQTPTQYIESGQGFFVLASSAGTLTFKNSHRVHNAPGQFYTPELTNLNRIWLKLENQQFNIPNQILLAFCEEASAGYDRLFDGIKKRGNENISFYSLMSENEEQYVIQSLPALTDNSSVNLGFFAGMDGDYTISIDSFDNFPVDFSIILEDLSTQTKTDLRKSSYTFNTSMGEYNNRFVLHLINQNLVIESPVNQLRTNFFNNSLYIYPTENEIVEFSLYNISGQLIRHEQYRSEKLINISLNEFDKGCYLYQLNSNSINNCGKIFVK